MKRKNKNRLMAAAAITILGIAYNLNIAPTSQNVWQNMKKEDPVYQKSNLLPQSVRYAIIEKFAAYAVKDFSLTQDGNYKVTLKNEQSKMIVFYHPDGEYLKKEVVKPLQIVALR